MTRTRVRFSCTECGAQAPKWLGRCPECGGWDTLAEESVPGSGTASTGGGAGRHAHPARRRGHRCRRDAADGHRGARPGARRWPGRRARSRCSAVSRASARARSCSRRSPAWPPPGRRCCSSPRRSPRSRCGSGPSGSTRSHPNLLIVAETSLAARAHARRRGRARRARGRLDPDGRRSRRAGRPGFGEPGARVRAPAGAHREGPQHPHPARRARHEGRRDRRAAHARAHRGHRARVRRATATTRCACCTR